MKKKLFSVSVLIFILVFIMAFVFLVNSLPVVSAGEVDFYGHVMNSSNKSQGINNTNVTLTIWEDHDTINQTYSNLSNGDGRFNITGINYSNESFDFTVEFIKYNDSESGIYVGPSLPRFTRGQLDGSGLPGPGNVTEKLQNNTFYMREGAMINITTTNSIENATQSRSHEHFSYYQIKDEKTGYIVEDRFIGDYYNFTNNETDMVNNTVTYVPADKNYSVMIAPAGTLPVNTKIDSSDLTDDGYHHIEFNTTENSEVRLNGTVSINGEEPNFTSLYVLVYLMDQGRMVYMGDNGGSAFLNITDGNDEYNTTSGYYNISTIGIADSSEAIVMPVGFNSSGDEKYYSGFKNAALNFDGPNPGEIDFNLTEMRGNESSLGVDTFGNEPGSWEGDAGGFGYINASLFNFNVLDSNNDSVSDAWVEIELDYSSLNMTNFTFITGGSNIEVPLLHDAGIKRINVFSRAGAPLKTTLSNSTLSEDENEYNLTLRQSMGGVDPETGKAIEESFFIDQIELKDSCFVPNYNASECSYFGANQNMSTIDPFGVVMSGAKMSFVMRNANNITVMYKNTDLLASGPPDIAFDSDSSDTSEGSTFAQAWRFGSSGPEIYDEVIIGMPYTPGSSSQTGFDEDKIMNLTINNLYDREYNSVWNSSAEDNITDIEEASVESVLYNFKDYLGTEYENYLNGSYPECNENYTTLNSSNGELCYKDEDKDMLWFRIPHFSGVGASPTGSIIEEDTDDNGGDDTSSGGGGGGSVSGFWENTYVHSDKNLKDLGKIEKELLEKQRIKLKTDNEIHYVGIIELEDDKATINVSSESQQAEFQIGDEVNFDVTGDDDYDFIVKLNNISDNKADLTITSIEGEVINETEETTEENDTDTESQQETGNASTQKETEEEKNTLPWKLFFVIAIIVVIFSVAITLSYPIIRKKINSLKNKNKNFESFE